MENIDIEKLKKFIGVRFINFGESNDVIPKEWVDVWRKKTKKCKWPNANSSQLARNRTGVEDDWKAYKILPLCHASKLTFNM